ncbi:MAG: V-type ATPase 116kDa subunit family protein, partial [Bacteroidaceae bacterium]
IFFGMALNVCKITKQHGIKYALAPLGWIVGLLSTAAVVGIGALGIATSVFSYILYVLIGISALLAFFYNTPGKNPLINFSTGLWDTYNMASGILGDTLSYIRLFALGLAGAVLGGVFNDLAFDLTSSLPLVAQIVAAGLILLIGHSINIGLCLIAAFVHPLRLTFVEFYKNAGFEGGGIVYKPFRK